jgi:putative endonuclease
MSSQNLQIGKEGEIFAASYILGLGYTILDLNWRHRHWELDIIATIGNTLHFIEVKTRSSLQFGHPEEHISSKKMRHLKNAACHYHYLHPNYKNIQFDVIAINFEAGKIPTVFFIEDVYF